MEGGGDGGFLLHSAEREEEREKGEKEREWRSDI